MKTALELQIEGLIKEKQYYEALTQINAAMKLPSSNTRLALYRMTCFVRLDMHQLALQEIQNILCQKFMPPLSINEVNYIFLMQAFSHNGLNNDHACLDALSKMKPIDGYTYYQGAFLKAKIFIQQQKYSMANNALSDLEEDKIFRSPILLEEYYLLKCILMFRNNQYEQAFMLGEKAFELGMQNKTFFNQGLKIEVMKILLEHRINTSQWHEGYRLIDEIERLLPSLNENHRDMVRLESLFLKGRLFCEMGDYENLEQSYERFIVQYETQVGNISSQIYRNQLFAEFTVMTTYQSLKKDIRSQGVQNLEHRCFDDASECVRAERDLAKAILLYIQGNAWALGDCVKSIQERYIQNCWIYPVEIVQKWLNLTTTPLAVLLTFAGFLADAASNDFDTTSRERADELNVMMITMFEMNVSSNSATVPMDTQPSYPQSCAAQLRSLTPPPKI